MHEEVNSSHKRNFALTQAVKGFNKAFCIGANKTGTTTFSAIFQALGLKLAPQHLGELTSFTAAHGDLSALKRYVEQFDAFQDVPFSRGLIFAQLDALFPNSKFILTRRDPEKWFESMHRFHKKIMGVQDRITPERFRSFQYLFPGHFQFEHQSSYLTDYDSDNCSPRLREDLLYNKEHYISVYESRNRAIMEHFMYRPDDLLVIDITQESDIGKVIEFLRLPESMNMPVPHLNKT